MKTLSMDLRERIMVACDAGQWTRREVADRFMVSLGMVKKLLAQRQALGHVAPQHKNAGRKPKITADHQRQLRDLIQHQPDLTLDELRSRIGVECSLPAIHYVLKAMGLSFKKRHLNRASRIARTSPNSASNGDTR